MGKVADTLTYRIKRESPLKAHFTLLLQNHKVIDNSELWKPLSLAFSNGVRLNCCF